MTTDNGKPKSLREVLNDICDATKEPGDAFLRDMKETYPFVRLAIGGGPRNGHAWPGCVLKLSRLTELCVARLECAPLEVEASWSGWTLADILETMNTDLENDTTRWQPNWKGRERQQRKILGLTS